MKGKRIAVAMIGLTVTGAAYAAGRTQAPAPKGYVVAEIDVKDAAAYERYKPIAAAAIARHGGRYLVRGGAAQAIEGAAPAGRVVVLEFGSVAAAMAFENSPDYRAAAAIRHAAANSRVFVVEGAPQ